MLHMNWDKNIKRYKFEELFRTNPDDTLSPIRPIVVNQVVFDITSRFWNSSSSSAGVNFFRHKNQDIAAEEKDDRLIIKGFFKK